MNIEYAKIIVSICTPITVIFIGAFLNYRIKNLEKNQQSSIRIKEFRKAEYSEISHKLNIIACYVADVADFGNYTPMQILSFKQLVERNFYCYKSIWPNNVCHSFTDFMNQCFTPYSGGMGFPAKINGTINEKKAYYTNMGKNWETDWDRMFSNTNNHKVLQSYYNLIDLFIQSFIEY